MLTNEQVFTAQASKSVIELSVESRAAMQLSRIAVLLILLVLAVNSLWDVVGLFFLMEKDGSSVSSVPVQDRGVYLQLKAVACRHCVPYVQIFLSN